MTVPIVRSWPASPPPGRPHVVDSLERVLVSDFDYRNVRDRCLSDPAATGVIHLDWDVAVLKEDLKRMRSRALAEPAVGFVAPYRLYPGHWWAHGSAPGVPVTWGADTCVLPCWGCIYVPCGLLEAWRPVPHDPRMTDTNFAAWAHRRGVVWPIDWTVTTVHLHW